MGPYPPASLGAYHDFGPRRWASREDQIDRVEVCGGRPDRCLELVGQVDFRTLDDLEPVISDDEQFRPTVELFYWPLGLALLLAVGLLAGGLRRALLSWTPAEREIHG